MINKNIVDTKSDIYKDFASTLTNWNSLTGRGEGVIGAQKTFHVIYKYVVYFSFLQHLSVFFFFI